MLFLGKDCTSSIWNTRRITVSLSTIPNAKEVRGEHARGIRGETRKQTKYHPARRETGKDEGWHLLQSVCAVYPS
ncbi:hypothetical protein GJ744_006788 [Endocarpon pusillum]|uniref:Uncharacterized protein n=1 Tax=Endocarpon pusillum TaxID=364733 RepID=A0A8H7ANS2_9EURO|nr:hypothetical protein GJ744_006788 [Endocarpon pusillum]